MSASLEQVLFNHDAADKSGSALNLRVDYDEAIVGAEWIRAPGRAPLELPIAYAARRIDPARIGVFANFSWRGLPPQRLEIKAVPDRPRSAGTDQNVAQLRNLAESLAAFDPLLSEYYAYLADLLSAATPILGRIPPTPVTIGAAGESGPVFCKLDGGLLRACHVGIHEIAWRWQYRTAAAPKWRDFQISNHRIFTTLELPVEPWSQEPAEIWNSSLPWSSALEIVCTWAAGATSRSEVTAAITAGVHRMGDGLIEYGCPVFAVERYTNTPLGFFDLTAFLERVEGGLGNGPYVNCTDCACAVSTLANLLGAQLWQGRMGEYYPAFMLRPSQTIGDTSWGSPCNLGLGFMFHEVGWNGQCSEYDQIYDASVVVDANLSPFPHFPVPLLPAGIQFGSIWQTYYRRMLAAPNSLLVCHPLPEERRRRALI